MESKGRVEGRTADSFVPSRAAMMEYYRRNKQEWVIAWLCGENVDFPFEFKEIETKVEN